jgi:putative transposase
MCVSLSVSEGGYYKWKRNRSRPKAWQILLAEIHKILAEHPDNDNYGVERMMIALEQRGTLRSYSTVKRAMKKGNLLHESRRSPDGLTKADKLDCYRAEIVSLAMDTNMKKELCITAINDAYTRRNPGDGVIIHSDAGSQYTSRKYKKTLGDFHAFQSMSDVAKCYDNARMESWFATLKKEKIYKLDTAHMTVAEVKKEVWRYTFAYYNTVRVTTVTEDGFPPSVYKSKVTATKSVA